MRSIGRIVLAFCVAAGVTSFASAQQASTSSETKNFEVIAVVGNDLTVRLPEGTRELTVPDSFRFTVNGKQMSVHELRPGMSGTAVITTTTTLTPVTVTEIKSGTVAQVAGSSIIVRTDEGVRSFSQSEVDKRGIKILRDGKPAQLSEFRAGDKLSATIITSLPPRVLTEKEVQATLAPPAPAPQVARAPAPAPPPAPVAAAPSSVGTGGSAASPAPARELPKTAGPLPLIGLISLTSLGLGAALTARRRRLSR